MSECITLRPFLHHRSRSRDKCTISSNCVWRGPHQAFQTCRFTITPRRPVNYSGPIADCNKQIRASFAKPKSAISRFELSKLRASAHNIAWPTGAFCGQVDRVICAGLMSVVVPKKDEIGTSGTQEAFLPLVVTLHRSDQSIIGLCIDRYLVLRMKRRHVQIPRIGRNASKRFGLSSNRQLP